MTVVVESKRVKVTQSLRDFVHKHADKIVKKLGNNVIKMSVHLETISKKHNDPSANIVTYLIAMPGRKVIMVRKTAVDMYEAIAQATKEAFRHVRKARDRRLDIQHGKAIRGSVAM